MNQKRCFAPIFFPLAQYRVETLVSMSSRFLLHYLPAEAKRSVEYWFKLTLTVVYCKKNECEIGQRAMDMNKLAFYAFILHGSVRLCTLQAI